MPKGTSRAEAMLNSEKIKPVAIAVIELCLTEGIIQSGSQFFIYFFYFFPGLDGLPLPITPSTKLVRAGQLS